jgi:hypothetical protein
MKKPRSYSEFLVTSNRSWLAERGASLHARYAGAASDPERPLARSSSR